MIPRFNLRTSISRAVADEWVTQLLRQGDAKVFKKYKLQMKREERWWAVAGSNRGPPACKAGALTS